MDETVLMGRGTALHRVAARTWRQHLPAAGHSPAAHLAFMTGDHHRVRDFVVRELPRHGGRPLDVGAIGRALRLAPETVNLILEALERRRFFLVRDAGGRVTWAFPVTVEPTAHRLTFNTGERIFAA